MRNTLMVIVACTATAGCESFRGAPAEVVSASEDIAALESVFSTENVVSYYSLTETTDAAKLKRMRNAIVSARMLAIDRRYTDFVIDLSNTIRSGNFATSVASIALTATATLFQVELVKNILTSVDTGLKGATEAFDKDILLERTLGVLVQQMDAERTRIATTIWSSLEKDIDEFPLALALSRVDDYYRAGTLNSGLSQAEKVAANQAADAAEEFDRTVLNFVACDNDPVNNRLKKWLDEGDDAQAIKRDQIIQKALNASGIKINDLVPQTFQIIESCDARFDSLKADIVRSNNISGS
ncbi:MAG: hypothetical protein ACFB03_09090 [Paracoccaceae bacterium]